jgi:pimeloyl-ACP methyl ester carboxylesterase
MIKSFEKGQMALKTGSYEALGRQINYIHTNFNDSSKTLVIYIHGSPGSSKDFVNNMKDSTMRQHFEMISVDRPGFGHSGFGKAESNLDKQAAAVLPLLQMHKNRKIILVGHSYGGPVVARVAMLYNDLIDGCLIVAGSVSPELEPHEWWRKPMASPVIRWIFPRSIRASNDEIRPLAQELERIKGDWQNITVPVTVIQGLKDFLVPPENADYVEEMAVNSKYLKIVRIPEVNHFIPFQQHYLITDQLLDMDN